MAKVFIPSFKLPFSFSFFKGVAVFVNPHPPFCGRVMGVPPSIFKNGDESFEDPSKNVEARWANDSGY